MYIFREIFHLHFGRYREAKVLLDQARQQNLILEPPGFRVLTDFTGEGYRLIMELPFATLADYEHALSNELGREGWREWYEQFKPLVRYSEREVLRQVL